VVKNWQLIGGGSLAAGAPFHGTTGTMDNPALKKRRETERERYRTGGNGRRRI